MLLLSCVHKDDTHLVIKDLLLNPDCDYYLFPRQCGVTTAVAGIVNQSVGKCLYLGDLDAVKNVKSKYIGSKIDLNTGWFYSNASHIVRDYAMKDGCDILYIDNKYWLWESPLSKAALDKLSIAAKKIVFVSTIGDEGIKNVHIDNNHKLQIVQFSIGESFEV